MEDEFPEWRTDSSKAAYVEGKVKVAFIATSTPGEPRRFVSRQNFRGLSIIIIHRLLKILLLSLFPAKGSSVAKCFLLSVIFELVLSTFKVANVHAILNLHPQVSLYRRTFNQSMWFDIFPATLLYATASNTCFYLTICALRALGFMDHQFTVVSRKTALYIVLAIYEITYLGGLLPAYAIFLRIAASLNPDQASHSQATRHLSIKGAWLTLSWSTLARLVAMFFSVFFSEFLAVCCMGLFSLIYFPEHRYGEVGLFFIKYFG